MEICQSIHFTAPFNGKESIPVRILRITALVLGTLFLLAGVLIICKSLRVNAIGNNWGCAFLCIGILSFSAALIRYKAADKSEFKIKMYLEGPHPDKIIAYYKNALKTAPNGSYVAQKVHGHTIYVFKENDGRLDSVTIQDLGINLEVDEQKANDIKKNFTLIPFEYRFG